MKPSLVAEPLRQRKIDDFGFESLAVAGLALPIILSSRVERHVFC